MTDVFVYKHRLKPFELFQELNLQIHAEWTRETDGFSISVVLTGDLPALRLPARGEGNSPGRRDGLWQTTCFEAFVRLDDGRYFELNCSPTGAWNFYGFSSYREGMHKIAASYAVLSAGGGSAQYSFKSRLHCEILGAQAPIQAYALSSVIEQRSGQLSYWAIAHPTDKPDFHAITGFRRLSGQIGADRSGN